MHLRWLRLGNDPRLRIDFLNFYHLSNNLILPVTKPGSELTLASKIIKAMEEV